MMTTSSIKIAKLDLPAKQSPFSKRLSEVTDEDDCFMSPNLANQSSCLTSAQSSATKQCSSSFSQQSSLGPFERTNSNPAFQQRMRSNQCSPDSVFGSLRDSSCTGFDRLFSLDLGSSTECFEKARLVSNDMPPRYQTPWYHYPEMPTCQEHDDFNDLPFPDDI